jgi:hypothetical protein
MPFADRGYCEAWRGNIFCAATSFSSQASVRDRGLPPTPSPGGTLDRPCLPFAINRGVLKIFLSQKSRGLQSVPGP